MSAEIISLADRFAASLPAARERLAEPAQVIALPPVLTAGAPAGDAAGSAGNAAAAAAALRAACRDLAVNLAAIRNHAQSVRDSMNTVHKGAIAIASGGGAVVEALRDAVALRPAFAGDVSHG